MSHGSCHEPCFIHESFVNSLLFFYLLTYKLNLWVRKLEVSETLDYVFVSVRTKYCTGVFQGTPPSLGVRTKSVHKTRP